MSAVRHVLFSGASPFKAKVCTLQPDKNEREDEGRLKKSQAPMYKQLQNVQPLTEVQHSDSPTADAGSFKKRNYIEQLHAIPINCSQSRKDCEQMQCNVDAMCGLRMFDDDKKRRR